jgi:Fe-S cluster assembly ATP-binding protein
MLEIKNLHARIAEDGTEIIRGLNLTVKAGEVAAIMGPNGSGKSTLSYILAGRDDYEVTEGDILYNGESILDLDPSERAAKGIFLAFQYPVEIPGVATMQFLKVAMNEQRKARGEEELKTPDFIKLVKEAAASLADQSGYAQASAQCRLFRRRKEARRNPPDEAAGAQALRA